VRGNCRDRLCSGARLHRTEGRHVGRVEVWETMSLPLGKSSR
jgi:hypothetical protein